MTNGQTERQGKKTMELICITVACMTFSQIGLGVTVDGVPTFSEIRDFRHPNAGMYTSIGPVVDVSRDYVGVLGLQSTPARRATEHNAFIFDAATGEHLWTLTQPVPPDNVNFRFASIAIDGDLAVVGATHEHIARPGGGTSYNAGAAYVYDLTTGRLKHKLISDTPQNNFVMGSSVDILGNHIAVGSWGNAYLFDATTGAQVAKLAPSTDSRQFGIAVALTETAVVVGSNSDPSLGNYAGAVYSFALDDYAQISKFVPEGTVANDNFGIEVAADGDYAIGSGRGGTFVFDIANGSQLTEVKSSESPARPYNWLDIQGNIALLGDPVRGRAATIDWTTGITLQELVPSDFLDSMNFGWSVAIAGNKAVVGAINRAYQFSVIPEPSTAILFLIGFLATVLSRSASRGLVGTTNT